jgi:hypothetical protein
MLAIGIGAGAALERFSKRWTPGNPGPMIIAR